MLICRSAERGTERETLEGGKVKPEPPKAINADITEGIG